MLPSSKVAAVIPCHNEAATIVDLVKKTRQHVAHVIVVDDGSIDGTGALATQAGAEVLRNESAQGKGSALRRGWQRAFESNYSFALTLDGDAQHSPADIPKFLNSSAPLVVGNRMTEAHKMPFVRRFVNRWMSCRLSSIAGRALPDTQCGFRLIDLNILSQLHIETTHFQIESELLLAFVAAGHPVAFVPVEVIYRREQSKIRPVTDSLRWFRWWREAFKQHAARKQSSLVPRPVVTRAAASATEHV